MIQSGMVGLVLVFAATSIGTSVIILKNRDTFPLGQISTTPLSEWAYSLILYVLAGLIAPALPPAVVGVMLSAMGYPADGVIFIGLAAFQLIAFASFTAYQWRENARAAA